MGADAATAGFGSDFGCAAAAHRSAGWAFGDTDGATFLVDSGNRRHPLQAYPTLSAAYPGRASQAIGHATFDDRDPDIRMAEPGRGKTRRNGWRLLSLSPYVLVRYRLRSLRPSACLMVRLSISPANGI